MAIGSFKLPISSGGNSVTPWVRPADWLPMPTGITSADQTFVGLYAIFPEGYNYATVLFTTSAGQYRVDWGDGVIDLVNSGVLAQHDYNYASISNSTLSTRGYKQAIITVTAVSGNLLTCNLQQRYVTSPTQNQVYSTGFLDCILSMPNASSGASLTIGLGNVKHAYLERLEVKTIGNCTSLNNTFRALNSLQSLPLFDTTNVTNMAATFSGCTSLQSVPLFNTINVTTMSFMLEACNSLKSVPLFNTINVTNMTGMFSNCLSLQNIPLFNTINVNYMSSMFGACVILKDVPLLNTANVANMSNMFSGCTTLKSVPLFNTISATDMTGMFNACSALQSVPLFNTNIVTSMATMFINCSSLQSVPFFNTANVNNMNTMFSGCSSINSVPNFSTTSITTTSGTDYNAMFQNCTSLDRCTLVFARTVALNGAQLSRTALVEIFTNLVNRSATTSATINITGNWGSSALTVEERAIATGKNWVITG